MSQGTKVFTGLEGLITVKDLDARRRQAQGKRFDDLKNLPGQEKAAATAGLLIGDIIARRLQPDEKRQRAETTQNIIREAEAKVHDADPIPGADPALSDFDQRIAIVSTAIRNLEDQGLTTEANQLKANRIQLNAQRLEKRSALQKLKIGEANLANTEANTARTQQLSAFDELGETKNIVARGGDGTLRSAQVRKDGTAVFTDDNGVERTLDSGQFFIGNATGSVDDLTPDKTKLRNATKQIAGINGVFQGINSLRDLVVNNKDDVSLQGKLFSALNQVRAGASSFIRDENGPAAVRALEGDIESRLQQAGIVDQSRKAAVTNLAFAIATSREGGKLTDQDFNRALETVGGNNLDPVVIVNSLDNLADNTRDNLDFLTSDKDVAALPQVDFVNRKIATNENQRRDNPVVQRSDELLNGRTQEQQDLLDQILSRPPQGQ